MHTCIRCNPCPKPTAMGRLWKYSCLYVFFCFLLVLAPAQALDVCHDDLQLSGPSSYHCSKGRLRLPRATRDCNPRPSWGEFEFVGAGCGVADVSRRSRPHSNSHRDSNSNPNSNSALNFKDFNMLLPHQSSDSSARLSASRSTRAALQLTPNRQAKEALTTFKAGIVGGNLSIFDSWDVNDATPCDCFGVTCSTSSDQITELSLVGYQLEGSINSALLALSPLQSLQRLDLSNNTFGSSISGASLLNFSNLAFMNLSNNQLEGRIPHELGELTNLQSLAFQFNQLSGPIPPSLCNCTLLRELNLQENLLIGEFPRYIGRLFRLESLVLGSYIDRYDAYFNRIGNSLIGGIPRSLGNCSSLSVFDLDLNTQLGGQIPTELSQLHNLQVFSCIACALGGVIPRWIGNLTDLAEIHLSYNNLQGAIPAEIGRLRNLSWLALGFARNFTLSGNILESIGNCTSLTRLRVSVTSITGIIPASIANCSGLVQLTMYSNPLMVPAPIPSLLSLLTKLDSINLGETNRIGPMPSELWRLPRLEILYLVNNALVGPISSSVSNCTSLINLSLGKSNLTGKIPFKVGALSKLFNLDVVDSFLTGSIPSSIANLTQITFLGIGYNGFLGTIDSRFVELQYLFYLSVAGNYFVGSIPTTLGNCSYLEQLYLNYNSLTGEIPVSLGNLSRLEILCAFNNDPDGEIPVDLASIPALTTLDLSSNILRGNFPQGLGRIPFLTYLNLSHNQLTGAITDAMRNFSQILWLDISYNQFSGRVPWESISNLKHMVSINVSHNFFFGSVSAHWTNFLDIQEIEFSANNLSGSIPNVENLQALQRLDLSFNNFSGRVPESLASLSDLVFLNLSYNNLDGPVPDFVGSGSNITAASFLGNPGLCGVGFGPEHECRQNVSSTTRGKCKIFQCTKTWIPFLAAGIASIVFLLAVVACLIKRSRMKSKNQDFDILLNLSSAFLKFSPIDVLAIIEDEANVIGATANNVIYKGVVPGYDDVMAIKTFVSRDNDNVAPGAEDLFRSMLEREANLHAGLHHRNVLKMLSFCSHPKFQALLLEYMPQGSLHDHLYPRAEHIGRHLAGPPQLQGLDLEPDGKEAPSSVQRCELPLRVRLGIAIDIAEGMMYLHHECADPLIHGDIKPSNILLDEDMVA